ncbi:MAG: Unknown protein [uncultured Thiotrichaceae bacterium]|uniref:Uncharacterized protein n=1 Tax=uncultured Thiotrichaceae bacterium TaxID=298394 RepID=A0A6S6T220_9GAMM|nr:MAG: Unknown protein [uncultured Thiotrichaceae bacterium]
MKTDNKEQSNVQYLPNIEERRKRMKANQQHEASQHFTLAPDAYQSLTNLIQQLVDQLSTIIKETPALNGSQRNATITGGTLTSDNKNTELCTEFEANKQKWQNSRPHNYAYTLERSGFLNSEARKPIDITVNHDTITSSQFSDGSTGSVPDFNQLTIDDLLATIEKALSSRTTEAQIEYDPQFGYPTSIFIHQGHLVADKEVSLSASHLKNLDNPLISPPIVDDGTSRQRVSGGGVNIGGANIPDSKSVDIHGQQYFVGFLKTQLDAFADSFKPDIVDAAFGIYPWGTSNSIAAGTAFQAFINNNFPNGQPT